MSSCNFLFCQFIQDLCSAGTLVADHLMTSTFFQLFDQFWRKSGLCKGLKRLRYFQTHHLPVSGHGILATAGLPKLSIVSDGMLVCRNLL